jgi:translocator protein
VECIFLMPSRLLCIIVMIHMVLYLSCSVDAYVFDVTSSHANIAFNSRSNTNSQWHRRDISEIIDHRIPQIVPIGIRSKNVDSFYVLKRYTGNVCLRLHSGIGQIPSTASILGPNISLSIYMALIHILLGVVSVPIVSKAISTWYDKIDKPRWTPPKRVFGPAWTMLYSLMGIAYSRILQQLKVDFYSPSSWTHPLSCLWIAHLLLNLAWAPIFFGLQRLRVGLYINYGLIGTLCCLIVPWYAQIDILASYLVLPYATWLLFATCLNRSICLRNPGKYNTARFYTDLLKLQQNAAKYANS